jgi:hypothetical protein
MNKNVSFLLSGFVVLVLVTSALGSRAAHGNNMPPPVQGPSVDCNQDPSNSACQNPPPAANNPPPTITTGCGPGTHNSTCSTSPNPPPN